MIALNEANEYAAEVPFTLPSTSDPLTGVTGWSFTLGEVQIKLPGSLVWTNVAVNKIVEKGYGRYCARLTALQTVTAGIVAIKVTVAGAQPFFGYETIGTLGGDVPQGGDGYILFYLPDSSDPVYGTPVSTANFSSGGVLRVCLPNSVYRDCTSGEKSSVVNLGYGGYALPLDSSLTTLAGKIFIRAEYSGAQSFESYVTILGTGVTSDDDTASGTAPVIVRYSPDLLTVSPYMDLIDRAVGRLCEYAKSGDFNFGPFTDNVGGETFTIDLDGGLG